MKTKLLIIIPIVITLAILAAIAYDFVSLDKLCADDGGKRIGDTCFVPIITNSTKDTPINVNLSKIKTMKPNSMEFFYYPNPEKTENRDAFQKFILIRLPESLGGNAEDISAFRAYSVVSLTDHCLVKYWPEVGRQRLENPCRGDTYRAIDGLIMQNTDPIMITSPTALPHLVLSADKDGSLYVEPPTWTRNENGVISIGREMSLQEIRQDSEIIITSFAKSYPEFPLVTLDFAGYTLAEIKPMSERVEISYLDFSSMSGYVFITIEKSSTQEADYFTNLAEPNSEFWQIGSTVISVRGFVFDKNHTEPEQYNNYGIEFVKDGFKFRIEGKNIEFIKQEIVKNYFSEYKYDDMFLISKND